MKLWMIYCTSIIEHYEGNYTDSWSHDEDNKDLLGVCFSLESALREAWKHCEGLKKYADKPWVELVTDLDKVQGHNQIFIYENDYPVEMATIDVEAIWEYWSLHSAYTEYITGLGEVFQAVEANRYTQPGAYPMHDRRMKNAANWLTTREIKGELSSVSNWIHKEEFDRARKEMLDLTFE